MDLINKEIFQLWFDNWQAWGCFIPDDSTFTHKDVIGLAKKLELDTSSAERQLQNWEICYD